MTSHNTSIVAYKAVYMIPIPSPFVYIVMVLQQVVYGNWLLMYSVWSGSI
jgi:hypothetical protein